MANKKSWVGMLITVFIMAACDNGTNPSSNPISRIESTNLGTMTSSASGWRELLDSINRDGKYVNLDLSACTMTGTLFDPDATVATGKDKIVSIILPDAATSIEAGAFHDPTFKNFTNLSSVSGANITTIGNYSFVSIKLQSVDFPNAITIGREAFWGSSLKNANFPVVQSIGEDAFSLCSDLQSISFPASAEIGRSSSSDTYSNPFRECKKLTFTLSGSGSLSVIENSKALVRNDTILLAYPSASGNVTMNNITSLDGNVFTDCYDLISVNFPQVTSIGESAFYFCGSLQSVNFPQIISIGKEAFGFCSSLQSVNFPQVTSIGEDAFSSCSSLQSVNFPQVTSIGEHAFFGCDRLQSASFPEVITIGSGAFSLCSNLLSLNIPKVTTINSTGFFSTGDTTLTITMGSAAPTLGSYMFYDTATAAKTVRVKVPAGASGYSPFTGSSVTVSGTNTDANWANGFRGGSWNGSTWGYGGSSYINQNITVIIEPQ